MASAWLELHLALELQQSEGRSSRLAGAKDRLARALRTRWEHEFQTGHDLMQHALPAQEKTVEQDETLAING
jgi:hypothetical protein